MSWITVLKKRTNYIEAFDNFEPEKIARYDKNKINELMNNKGIIRNKLKIKASIGNAKAYLNIKETKDSFSKYLWGFVDGKTIINEWESIEEVPTETKESRAMSKDLKKQGFKFVGPTICYAFMQASGMVNDHTTDCFRYEEINRLLI